MSFKSRGLVAIAAVGVFSLLFLAGDIGSTSQTAAEGTQLHRVTVPAADQFQPFALTIHAGDVVQWVNNDTDDHTVVSDDPLNTVRLKVDHLLPGTDSNSGKPGKYLVRFDHPGTFVYYCKFHSHLDAANQPVAPGPRGGIQDANGNYGTPMSGVITVLPGDN